MTDETEASNDDGNFNGVALPSGAARRQSNAHFV
jgi:hypothetical protein